MRNLFPTVLIISLLASCGGYDNDDSDDTPPPPQQEQSQIGVFRAVLNPENESISSASGNAVITIENEMFNANVVLIGATLTTHAQHIHTGTRCPTPADDTNGDGVVDANEAAAVYGPVLVPLDSDLASSAGEFPSGILYNYSEEAPLADLLTNLGVPALNVEGLVVNIHGIPETVQLPATAQGGKAAFPISCGILERVGEPLPTP